jgi:hypothetical protein
MEKLLQSLLNKKGETSYRTILLIITVYVAVKVNDIEHRVAMLEQRSMPGIALNHEPK